jgi:hypothetical protein
MKDELERTWNEKVVAYFKVLYQNLSERNEENINLDILSAGRDF